jgi:hypothetical protein
VHRVAISPLHHLHLGHYAIDFHKALLSSVEFLSHPAFWIVLAAASELIALSPLKDNSIIQLLFHALRAIQTKKP